MLFTLSKCVLFLGNRNIIICIFISINQLNIFSNLFAYNLYSAEYVAKDQNQFGTSNKLLGFNGFSMFF